MGSKNGCSSDRSGGFLKISQEIYIREFLDQRGLLGTTGVDTPAIETGPDSNMTEEDLPQTDEEKDELKKLPF